MSRLEETRQIYQNAIDKLYSDDKHFAEYLKYSGRFYKIPASYSIALFESNPNATVFADFDTWKKFGNSVLFNQHSSAALTENGALKHYFDISQTTAKVIPFQWGITQEIAEDFLKQEKEIKGNNYRNFSVYLKCTVDKQISENSKEIFFKFPVKKEDKEAFIKSIATMVMAVITARCEHRGTYRYKNQPDLTALHLLKSKEDIIPFCSMIHENAKSILSSIEKSVIQIINIKKEERKNGRNANEQVNRGMEQQISPIQSSTAGITPQGGEAGNGAERAGEAVDADVHHRGEELRNDSLQAEQGAELHLQRSLGGEQRNHRTDGAAANRDLRQEMAGVYEDELSRNNTVYGQLELGQDGEESGRGSGAAVSDLGQTVPASQSQTDKLFGNGAVGKDEVNGDRSRGDGNGGSSISGELKENTEKAATASKEAAAVLSDTNSTIIPKREKSFAEQVDASLNKELPAYTSLKICDTPQILIDIGCQQLPMLYTQSHLRKAVEPMDNKEHSHGLSVEQIKRLPQLLEKPVMIFDSISKNDSIIVVTSEFDSVGNPIVVSVKPNGHGRYEIEEISSNFVTSVYGRNNFIDFFKRTIERDSVLYINKKRNQKMFERWGEQYSELTNTLDFNIIIHQSRNIVNSGGEEISEKLENPSNENGDTYSTSQDFTITDPNLGTGGLKTKCATNITAIKTLKKIEAENRTATPEEQEILSRYVGWGGIPQVFDDTNEKWSTEYAQLKELLTDEEYAAAKVSTLNAHYTSPEVIKAIYKALENMGFKTGNVLEPSMGVGNFFGCMPERMRKECNLYGVELDSITGRIAKQLYPNADIQVKGFEKTDYPDGFFDLAVGNVPFGGYGLADKRYDKEKFLIHDYFFAKALDKVAEGGIIAFITSKGTLDKANPKVREYIAKRADLLGAIRLPNNAFKANANTEVTSDIIFLQKRKNAPVKMPDWVYLGTTSDNIPINQYFAENPEMVLGKMEHSSKMYGGDDTTCVPFEDKSLSEQLNQAVSRLKTNIAIENNHKKQEMASGTIYASANMENFTYTVIENKVYFRENNTMKEVPLSGKPLQRMLGLIELRDAALQLIREQADNCTDERLKELQEKLNTLYDRFTKSYGSINDSANSAIFREDDHYNTICALEIVNPENHTVTKSEIFTQRTIKPNIEITHVDSPLEALQVSMDMKGKVDIPYMSELCGISEKEIITQLTEQEIIYLNPKGEYEEASEYLSGNIRQKLKEAELAAKNNPDVYSKNVKKLQMILPKQIEAGEIKARIGVSWVDLKDYEQFLTEYAKAYFFSVEPIRRTITGEYKVPNAYRDNSIAATSTYGTKRMSSYDIFEKLLNNRDIIVKDAVENPDGSKRYVINNKETQLAREKARQMQDAFSKWLWDNPSRRQKYVERYNVLFNSIVGREYDGSHQSFPGMSPYIKLNPHQQNAVARAKYGGNTLLAHCVGAGKSFEMAAAVMEKKRLGLISKACMVVPKHLVGQTANEWLRLYPQAKLLVASEKDFTKDNRQKFIARCCTGDYDAVVMSYEQFEKINMSFEYRQEFLNKEMEQIEQALKVTDKRERATVKDLQRAKKNLEKKITKLLEGGKTKDTSLSFENLGFDCLVVDEAHNYKNGLVVTKMSNVSGVQSTPAQKSEDILMKTRYLNDTYGYKNIIFATGTPVSNSMTELYTMQRYLRPDLLEKAGLQNFDDWASTFGEVVTQLELKPAGDGYRPKKRFSKFVNLPELMQMYKEFADIRTAEMLKLPIPEIDGGKPQTVVSRPNDFQKAYMQVLAARSERIHSGAVDPTEDNMLKITNEARLLGLDARAINPDAENYPDSKVNACIDNIMKIYEDTKEQKGVQVLFCDIAVNGNDGKFSVYDYIRSELEKRGIPKDEICAAGDAKDQKQRNEMYAQLRSGSKRIVLASTTKMGTGANIQTRLAAMHHLDIPWKPSDLEQRNGRILRQGNMFDTVKIFNYVTEDTFDSYMLSIIVNKQKFISQLMSGKTPARTCEDVDEMVLNYSEMQSLATGDPRIKEKIELDGEVARLRLLESEHLNKKYRLEDFISHGEKSKQNYETQIEKCKSDKMFYSENKPMKEDEFLIELNGKPYTERKEAAAVFQKMLLEVMVTGDEKRVGKYCGFDVKISRETDGFKGFPCVHLSKSKGLTYSAPLTFESDIGNIIRVENVLKHGIDKKSAELSKSLNQLNSDLQEAKQTKDIPFEFSEELKTKSARLEQLNTELNFDKPDEVVMLDDENQNKNSEDLEEKIDGADKPTGKGKPKR